MTRALFVLIGFLLCCVFVGPASSLAFSGKAKVTIKVVGEDGKAVEGADIGIGFQYNGRDGTDYNEFDGTSDVNGLYSSEAKTNGHVGWTVNKSGYYETRGAHDFHEKTGSRWKPWNPTVRAILRKIENPVPMYARNTTESRVEIPVVGEDVGFDLVKFDWGAPYGSGAHSDFIFHLKRRVVDRKDFDATLTVTFSNSKDGIQPHREKLKDGSLFKLPRYAPENGYQDTLVLREWRSPGDYNVKRNFDFLADDLSYIFRVRSEDRKDHLGSAMYGKILGFIDFTAVHSKTAKIYFQYYLNPDYTRNLEYDPERNLFGSLPSLEQVGIQ